MQSETKTPRRIDERVAHPPQWNPIRHFGHCGQSCPCCKSRYGELIGSCAVCDREADQNRAEGVRATRTCPTCDTVWTLDDDDRDWHTSAARPYCTVCLSPLPPVAEGCAGVQLASDESRVRAVIPSQNATFTQRAVIPSKNAAFTQRATKTVTFT